MEKQNIVGRFISWFERILGWFFLFLSLTVLALILLHEYFPTILDSIPLLKEIVERPNYLTFLLVALIFLELLREFLPKLEIISSNTAQIPRIEGDLNNLVVNFQSLVEKYTNQVDNLILLAKDKTVIIQPSKHPEIWEGFVNTYYVVNAPWLLEKFIETAKYEEMVKLHAKRYENEELKRVYYIFFKRNAFKNSIENFIDFMEKVVALNPITKEKVKVLILDKEAPKFSLFLGEKEFSFKTITDRAGVSKEVQDKKLIPYLILYIHEKPFIFRDGFPSWAVISSQGDLYNVLRTHVAELIHQAQENSTEYSLEEFIKLYKESIEGRKDVAS